MIGLFDDWIIRLRKVRSLSMIGLSLVFVGCNNTDNNANKIDSATPKRIHPPEALKLADSAFHTYFMQSDSCSLRKAVELYNQSLTIDPDNFISLHNKLGLESRLGMYPDALNTARRMLRLTNYKDVTCIGVVGGALELCGDTVQARKFYLWSLQVTETVLDTMETTNSNWLTFQLNKGAMYTWLDERDKADEALNFAIENVSDTNMIEPLTDMKGKTKEDYLALIKGQKLSACKEDSISPSITSEMQKLPAINK